MKLILNLKGENRVNNRTDLLYFERKDGGYYTNDQIETAYYI